LLQGYVVNAVLDFACLFDNGIDKLFEFMAKVSPVSMFLAATTLLVSAGVHEAVHAQAAGGLKEWSTDQAVDEKSKPDADAAALLKQAEQEDVCVPIGEGENCW
jgi:hypothetical protein